MPNPTPTQPMPEELRAAILSSNLGYLHAREPDRYCETKEPHRFQTHGSLLRGAFLRCLVGSIELPAGTPVWAFEHKRLSYSAWVELGDMAMPAKGAEISTTGSDWTLCAMVELENGERVLADAYIATEKAAPRLIGRVGE